jgi:hypothetical protein
MKSERQAEYDGGRPVVTFRMTSDLRSEVRDAALAAGLTESEWLRAAVANQLSATGILTPSEGLPEGEAMPHEEVPLRDRLSDLG